MTDRTITRPLSAIAFVRDITAAKKFYTEVLGFAIESDFGINVALQGGTALWQLDPNHIIPQHLGADAIGNQRVNRFELYFESEDIEGVCARVRASGAEFLHMLHEEPYGQRTVRFFDPDHHLVEVGEPMAAVVRRLHGGNMAPEQIARKTGMPLAQVSEILAPR
jgi:catechol 2,3-dioxygenase-like lactoylglutathione lyase family enzyme